ncbi:MAG: hypothetical protein ACRDJG_00525 [Actinomycetota bacterium]
MGRELHVAGAETREILSSVIATSRLQGEDPIEILIPLLTGSAPRLADLDLPGIEEEEWTPGPRAGEAPAGLPLTVGVLSNVLPIQS